MNMQALSAVISFLRVQNARGVPASEQRQRWREQMAFQAVLQISLGRGAAIGHNLGS
jgi:hypothetical protein